MTIQINGREESLDHDGLSVAELLKVKEVPDPDMVSVQLNGDILDRNTFSGTSVNDGDELEFLYFMGGGC